MTNVEIWKDIPNYEGLYQVSNLGSVKSIRKSLKIVLDAYGYQIVDLCKNGSSKIFRVHKLVATAFLGHIPCGHGKVVNHKNFIKTDNRVENLEIVSNRQNTNKKHIKHSSIYTGVFRKKSTNKWIAQIRTNNKQNHLGHFTSEHEAHLAYEKALALIKYKEQLIKKIKESKGVRVSTGTLIRCYGTTFVIGLNRNTGKAECFEVSGDVNEDEFYEVINLIKQP